MESLSVSIGPPNPHAAGWQHVFAHQWFTVSQDASSLGLAEQDPSPGGPKPRADQSLEPGSRADRPFVVLVEDNPADALLVKEALREHNVECELTVLGDGEKAIQFLSEIDEGKHGCPALVILDLNLPRRSGREVLEFIRGRMTCAGVPVVILSSSDRQKDKDETASLGITRYLRKPSRLDEFIGLGAIFRQILRGQKP